MQGDRYGALRLATAFDTDGVAPESVQRRDYWAARAVWLDPGYVHTKSFLRITQWALDTAPPCDPGNPRQLNADTVFRAGRVAFEARAGDVAACWFTISSNQRTLRADVYLGVMYYFGIGVEQNMALGLERLKKASDAKDPFAMLYLANFLRWGVGVKTNQQLGYSMMQEAMRLPNGPEVFRRVQGIVGGLNMVSTPQSEARARCQELVEQAKHSRDANLAYEASHCDSSEDLLGLFSKQANHTVDHAEEIFPEIFDPITLPTDDDVKQRAGYGFIRLTP